MLPFVDATRALDDGDLDALRQAAEQGTDLNRVTVPTSQGQLSILDAVLRRGDPELVAGVLALPGVTAAESLPAHGYWSWARHAGPEVVRAFVEVAGSDHRDAGGGTLLARLAGEPREPDPELIAWLLARDARDLPAGDGTSALFHAAAQGHVRTAELLLAAGSDPDVTSAANGWTAVITAVALGREAVLGRLLGAGADPDRADTDGATALHHAARLGAVPAVLAAVADPDKADVAGRTPLMEAARHGHEGAARLLLANPRTDVNRVDADRWTALHHAVSAGSAGTVRALLERADVNAAVTDLGGRPAAGLAADAELAELLAARAAGQPDVASNEPPARPEPPDLLDPHHLPGIPEPARPPGEVS
jgi:ankyrin repeat protein